MAASIPSCCLKAFSWDGTPTGHTSEFAQAQTYIAGNNSSTAILIIPDLFGWSFSNVRLLADHYASEANATVYVPDFFGGEALPLEPLLRGEFHKVDLAGFIERNSRDKREEEIFAFARALRGKYDKVAAVGFCYGGWAALRIGAKEHSPPLVDCVVVGHPSLMVEKDVDEVSVPVQFLAPEIDSQFTAELKRYTFAKLVAGSVPFEYQHFPGVEHACLVRGDPGKEGERDAMVRGKNAAVAWIRQWLRVE